MATIIMTRVIMARVIRPAAMGFDHLPASVKRDDGHLAVLNVGLQARLGEQERQP